MSVTSSSLVQMFTVEWFFCPDGITTNSGLTGPNNTNTIYIYIYIIPYPRVVEFSGEEVIVLPLASIASLFVDELRSRQPLNGCM